MAANYEVVKQETTIAQLPDGTFGQVVRITFRAGTALHVLDVPQSQYQVDTVRDLIEERVQTSEAITNL